MSIDIEIAAIKKRIDSAKMKQARAEVVKESEQKKLDDILRALREEFEVDNLSQVRAKLAELQEDLRRKADEATTILDQHKL